MNRATLIVEDVAKASLPDGAPLFFREVRSARFEGKNRVTADVIMFDGLPATIRLTRWAFGWSKGWDSMPGGDIYLEAGQWKRCGNDWWVEGADA